MQNKEKTISDVKKTAAVLNKTCKAIRGILLLIAVALVLALIVKTEDDRSFLQSAVAEFYATRFNYNSLNGVLKFIYIKTGIYGICLTYLFEFIYSFVICILLFDRLYRLLNLVQKSESLFSEEMLKHVNRIMSLLVAASIFRPIVALFVFVAGQCLIKVFEYGICLQHESNETV